MTNLILTESTRIIRQFETRAEAEEWLANNANEDGVLTGTSYAGQQAHLTDFSESGLEYVGWGVVGEPRDGVIVNGPSGETVDVSGYHTGDYWSGDRFLGPDDFGITPVYRAPDGTTFPEGAKKYPFLA